MNWDIRFDINTLPCVKQIAVRLLCDDLDGWGGSGGREVQEGRAIYIHIVDSLHCVAETNTTL